MSNVTVKAILRDINSLDEQDRLRLERALARRLEQDWVKEAIKARRIARSRRIGQKAIDMAVQRWRYGR